METDTININEVADSGAPPEGDEIVYDDIYQEEKTCEIIDYAHENLKQHEEQVKKLTIPYLTKYERSRLLDRV